MIRSFLHFMHAFLSVAVAGGVVDPNILYFNIWSDWEERITVNSPTDKLAHTEDDNYFMILWSELISKSQFEK